MPQNYLFIGCNGSVSAIDPVTGSEVWRRTLSSGFFAATSAEDVCILEHEGRVFAGCNGHLFCLDGGSGEVVWHNELEGYGYNDVTMAMAGKCIQYVATVRVEQQDQS